MEFAATCSVASIFQAFVAYKISLTKSSFLLKCSSKDMLLCRLKVSLNKVIKGLFTLEVGDPR